MLTISCPEVSASVSVDRWEVEAPHHGRWAFAYTIVVDPSSPRPHTIRGDDLRSGRVPTGTAPDLPDALRSLLAFATSGEGWLPLDSRALGHVAEELDYLEVEALGHGGRLSFYLGE